MEGCLLFQRFENGKFIDEKDLPKMVNYICGHLNSWSPNQFYFYEQNDLAILAKIVCRWRRENCLFRVQKKEKL